MEITINRENGIKNFNWSKTWKIALEIKANEYLKLRGKVKNLAHCHIATKLGT